MVELIVLVCLFVSFQFAGFYFQTISFCCSLFTRIVSALFGVILKFQLQIRKACL